MNMVATLRLGILTNNIMNVAEATPTTVKKKNSRKCAPVI